ncbi:hypothetical protein PTSG_12988 [Salpingoeca rosetta]|uniref:Uncharacterized protein n=1 Tax=Salpingoeca rosetta (strain ATCC 50818 / BSB-021) TaxID=946362 RepID=F2UPE1_SALR5|nr:uncharacterized protein PTSG_12988 [Salpingoeca rosetta]EGD79496.1 hypothetical protein PTSG_12988 [Salpingoeca rosetta]|eukprot:XP_004988977.1 hypothetical protein PTSG_12988 [Salpingoeca rosetta]
MAPACTARPSCLVALLLLGCVVGAQGNVLFQEDGYGDLRIRTEDGLRHTGLTVNDVDLLAELRRTQFMVNKLKDMMCAAHDPSSSVYTDQFRLEESADGKAYVTVVEHSATKKVFLVPFTEDHVVEYDPVTQNLTKIPLPSDFLAAEAQRAGQSGVALWQGAFEAQDGSLYAVPFASTAVLIIHPETHTLDVTTIAGLEPGPKYRGGVLVSDRFIVTVPGEADHSLIIDMNTNELHNITIDVDHESQHNIKWSGGSLGRDGKIYCVPRDANAILIIDPQTQTYDATTLTVHPANDKWWGSVMVPSGKIIGFPRNFHSVLVIDPSTQSTSLIRTSKDEDGIQWERPRWAPGFVGPDGRAYGVPATSKSVLVIDADAKVVSEVEIPDLPNTGSPDDPDIMWHGCIVRGNGRAYCAPVHATNPLVIDMEMVTLCW